MAKYFFISNHPCRFAYLGESNGASIAACTTPSLRRTSRSMLRRVFASSSGPLALRQADSAKRAYLCACGEV